MTMGTSQMLSCMEERIHDINPEMEVTCFGQEFNPSTFAIAKADMMIRGGNPDNMRFGDTLSDDKFKDYTFRYIISNPPFGIDWKREQKAVEAEAAKGEEGRFAPGLPKISDGQQLFVLNGLKKLGSKGKMAIIQNGSPLFSGDAGSGPSEIRRYILENDWLDCIVQLSTDMFMNTGISTYIWVLNKDKPAQRAGKVQLIDASHCFTPRRKSIGTKRNDISDENRRLIVEAYAAFSEGVFGEKPGVYCESKIFQTAEFGYSKIVVERPLRQSVQINDKTLEMVKGAMELCGVDVTSNVVKLGGWVGEREAVEPRPLPVLIADMALQQCWRILQTMKREEPYRMEEAEKLFNASPLNPGTPHMKFTAFEQAVLPYLIKKDPQGEIVEKRGNPLGDPTLRDTENVPLTEDIDAYFAREVLPYAPDAWIDRSKTKIGYEIPMTRYFYEYQAPEPVEDIMARITSLEQDISASLKALFHKEG